MSLPNLKGKGAIVTGGGSGICLAFVKELYAAGAHILIADLKLHRQCDEWLETIKEAEKSKQRIAFQRTDVTDWKQLEAAFDAFAQKFGGVPDIVCPGAGVYEPSVPNFWNDKDQDTYLILRINLEHPIKMSRIAIRKMLQNNVDGVIVFVSSTGAQKSSIITPLYQAAKHGISNFTRCMAKLKELGNIKVVAVAPGPTFSPLMYDHPEALRFVDPEKDSLAQPEEIGRGMMAIAFDDKFPPGTVLEVTHPDKWREVFLLNDPGPQGSGWTSKKDEAISDVIAAIKADRESK